MTPEATKELPRCDSCGSENVTINWYEYGIEGQTGYRSFGYVLKCLDCGELEVL